MVTLPELMVVVPIALMLFGAVFGLYQVSVREQIRGENRARSIVQQKNGLERMTRELRQATSIVPVGLNVVDADTWVRSAGATRWVRYDCSSGACERREALSKDGLEAGRFTRATVVVVDDVRKAEFDLRPVVDPNYVTVMLEVNVKDANDSIVLNDGFDLRNLTTPG